MQNNQRLIFSGSVLSKSKLLYNKKFFGIINKPEYLIKHFLQLYKQDKITGKIEMAVSKDSTCTSDLNNATSGFETFVLAPKTETPWPPEARSGVCSFPKWMFGNWEHVRVEGDTIVYKDHSSFKTYTIKCVGAQEDEKFLIFSRTQW